MAATTNFKIDGAAEMVRLLKELGPRVADRVGDQALRAGAKPIVTRAKELAPVLTGQLRDDIAAEIERQGKGSDTRRIEIGVRKPTSRRQPMPRERLNWGRTSGTWGYARSLLRLALCPSP